MNKTVTFNVYAFEADTRLDHFLAQHLSDFSRSHIQNMIRNGDIIVYGCQVKTGYKLQPDDEIKVNIIEAEAMSARPEDIQV